MPWLTRDMNRLGGPSSQDTLIAVFELSPGERVADFVVEGPLGNGGLATVYRAGPTPRSGPPSRESSTPRPERRAATSPVANAIERMPATLTRPDLRRGRSCAPLRQLPKSTATSPAEPWRSLGSRASARRQIASRVDNQDGVLDCAHGGPSGGHHPPDPLPPASRGWKRAGPLRLLGRPHRPRVRRQHLLLGGRAIRSTERTRPPGLRRAVPVPGHVGRPCTRRRTLALRLPRAGPSRARVAPDARHRAALPLVLRGCSCAATCP